MEPTGGPTVGLNFQDFPFFSRRGIAHLQSRQSGLTDEVRTNRESMQRNIKDQIQQRREKIRQLSAVEQFAKRNFSEFKHVQQAPVVSYGHFAYMCSFSSQSF